MRRNNYQVAKVVHCRTKTNKNTACLDFISKIRLLDHKGNKLFLEKYFFTSFGDQVHHQKKWVANGWVGELYTGKTENNNMMLIFIA